MPGTPTSVTSSGDSWSRARVIGLEDPGLRLHDLAECPKALALPVGKGAALPPPDELGIGVEHLEQFDHEPALADAGDADERDELCGLLAPAARERVVE